MKTRLLVLAALVLTTTAAPGQIKKTDQDRLQGDWQAERAVSGGKPLPANYVKAIKFTIEDDKLIDRSGDKEMVSTFKLGSTKKPRSIDLSHDDDGKKALGIYELDGNTLKLCINARSRPKEFRSPDGSTTFYFVLKRIKK